MIEYQLVRDLPCWARDCSIDLYLGCCAKVVGG